MIDCLKASRKKLIYMIPLCLLYFFYSCHNSVVNCLQSILHFKTKCRYFIKKQRKQHNLENSKNCYISIVCFIVTNLYKKDFSCRCYNKTIDVTIIIPDILPEEMFWFLQNFLGFACFLIPEGFCALKAGRAATITVPVFASFSPVKSFGFRPTVDSKRSPGFISGLLIELHYHSLQHRRRGSSSMQDGAADVWQPAWRLLLLPLPGSEVIWFLQNFQGSLMESKRLVLPLWSSFLLFIDSSFLTGVGLIIGLTSSNNYSSFL